MDFSKTIYDHIATAQVLLDFVPNIEQISKHCQQTVDRGNKILLAGNGGSAADAQHIAAEFVGRFVKERKAFPAIALTTDTSALTAIGNDYGFDQVFARQINGLGQKGDAFIAISTSGNSPNIIAAVKAAKTLGIYTIGLLGKDGGQLQALVDYPLVIPSDTTARIQEMHILVGHLICEYVDHKLNED